MKKFLIILFLTIKSLLGDGFIVTDSNNYIYHIYDDSVCLLVSNSKNSGIYYSTKENLIGYKEFIKYGDDFLQSVNIYNTNLKSITPLSNFYKQVGLPDFSKKYIAYFQENSLIMMDTNFNIIKTINIGHFANIIKINPGNNNLISWTDFYGNLIIFDIEKEQIYKKINLPEEGYAAYWSQNGKNIIVPTVNGKIFLIQNYKISKKFDGINPIWLDDKQVLYFKIVFDKFHNPIKSIETIYNITTGQSLIQSYNKTIFSKAILSGKNKFIYYDISNNPYIKSKNIKKLNFSKLKKNIHTIKLNKRKINNTKTSEIISISAFDSIYFHQVYDIRPDKKDGIGGGCCGAASTIMGLIYYNKLSPWPITCYSPYTHTSLYGNYITEKYRLYGVNYDILYIRHNTLGYGIYGWIYRNSLEDTKGHMAELIRNHGIDSPGPDWSPSFSKLQTEINNQNPIVVLNSLTNAGHYIVAVGYLNDKKVAVFNDPYGDRNNSTYLKYKAIKVKYDWPGQNNGYANLNHVWCYNYLRPKADIKAFLEKDFNILFIKNNSYKPYFIIQNIGTETYQGNLNYKYSLIDTAKNEIIDSQQITINSMAIDETKKIYLNFDNLVIDSNITNLKLEIYCDIDSSEPEISYSNNSLSKIIKIRTDTIKPSAIVPLPDTTIFTNSFYIKVRFSALDDLNPDEMQLYIDSTDYTDKASFSTIWTRLKVTDLPEGKHNVLLKATTKCGYSQDIKWSFTTSYTKISEHNNNQKNTKIKIYPNPCNKYLIIESPASLNLNASFYTLDGKKIYTTSIAPKSKTQINISQFPSGIYLIKIKEKLIQKITILK